MAMNGIRPPSSARPKPAHAPSNNLAKALLEAGGHAVQGVATTGAQMMGEALGSLLGANTSSTPSANQQNPFDAMNGSVDLSNPFGQTNQNGESLWNQEQVEQEWKEREARIIRHREVQQTEVYNARQAETDQKIQQLLAELHALAKDLDKASAEAKSASIAVMQGNVNAGGEYHVTFFQHLLKVIVLLRKRVQESTTWLQEFNSRGKAKQGYWNQFYSNGTQWSMSSERGIATSVG